MKLIIKVTILISLIIFISSLNLKSKSSVKEDFTTQWTALFTTIERPASLCARPDRLWDGRKKDELEEGGDPRIPRTKPNPYNKNYGFNEVGYLFDMIDEIFKTDMLAAFKKAFNEAKALPDPPETEFADPYTVDKILTVLSETNNIPPVTSLSEDQKLEYLGKLMKTFNPEVWKNSLPSTKIHMVVKNWGYENPYGNVNYAKKLTDKFDFNGDGRLSVAEFILWTVIANKKIWRTPTCKNNCYEDVLKNKIDPIFAYLDCDNDGFISSENIWAGFHLLKRQNPKLYDIYSCQLPTILNKGFRTSSPNDFILKNYEEHDGFVNLQEFRLGILLGYWDRLTMDDKILEDESKTLKNIRWINNGAEDKECTEILNMIKSKGGVDQKSLQPSSL